MLSPLDSKWTSNCARAARSSPPGPSMCLCPGFLLLCPAPARSVPLVFTAQLSQLLTMDTQLTIAVVPSLSPGQISSTVSLWQTTHSTGSTRTLFLLLAPACSRAPDKAWGLKSDFIDVIQWDAIDIQEHLRHKNVLIFQFFSLSYPLKVWRLAKNAIDEPSQVEGWHIYMSGRPALHPI